MPLGDPNAEWLEADGLGGFASGTTSGIRTRRYHALLLPATTPPAGRMVLVNGFDAWVESPAGKFAISSQRYAPEVVHPDGHSRLASFTHEPWPTWRYDLGDGLIVSQELFVPHGRTAIALSWRVEGNHGGGLKLRVCPFLSGRDFHSTHHENPAFRFETETAEDKVIWRPYQGVPEVVARSNGRYVSNPAWYHNFLYAEEQERGLDAIEDLAMPGVFEWILTDAPASLVLSTAGHEPPETFDQLRQAEASRRATFPSPLHRAADAYIVKRGAGKTVIAGYPWFGDWGRDTFIAMRGLCIATRRLEEARDILLEWADAVSDGMLPNRFPDSGEKPEYNSVDASLWYVIAVHEYLQAAGGRDDLTADCHTKKLRAAVEAILEGYSRGTRFGIKVDTDGLLAAGTSGVQLTWMDAKVGDWVVTPRIGKPVEVNALWLNALWIGSRFDEKWNAHFESGVREFCKRFWNPDGGFLHDVIDCNHQPGVNDSAFRPNQIFAAGGLPVRILDQEKAERVVKLVEERLLTPLGLRSLAPGEPDYKPRYEGGVVQRDGSYHQGTVWPWLIGPFVDAWMRIHGDAAQARERFLNPLIDHLGAAGLGHVSEIADADAPHTPRGCPFQAWSVGELLRLQIQLGDPTA